MNYHCQCGFEADIKSDHQITYCPSCHKDSQGRKEKTFGEKFKEFGDWLAEPVTVLEYVNTNNPEMIRAIAEMKSSQAEILRAQKQLPEPAKHQHQHIHLTTNKTTPQLIAHKKRYLEEYDDY